MRHRAASAPTSDASSVDSLSRAVCAGGGCSIWATACGGVSDAHGRRLAGRVCQSICVALRSRCHPSAASI
eukprot:2015992-Pyramimonas_sp.AAC.1